MQILSLELADVTPRVWRLLRVPDDLPLLELHHAIQALFGWRDFHQHVFEIGDADYGPAPDEPEEDEDDTRVREPSAWRGDDAEISVAEALALAAGGFAYVYDFGDDWRVRIVPRPLANVAVSSQDDPVTCLDGGEVGPQGEEAPLAAFSVEEANRALSAWRRRRATPERPAGPRASRDQQWLARFTLAVLMLSSRPGRRGAREASRMLSPEVLERLSEAGLIDFDPRQRTVTLTDQGVAEARRLLEKLPNV